VEWWYRHGPRAAKPAWIFVFPENREGARALELPADTLAQMRPDYAKMGAWSKPSGQWLAFYFRWYAGSGRARILAMRHKPDGCLPLTGWTLVEERAPVEVRAGDLTVPFRALTFTRGSERAHVYFCVWQDTADGHQPSFFEDHRRESLRLVARGESGLGQQILELVLSGPTDGVAADEIFRKEMPLLLMKN
jgi:hypothetical protein